MTMNKLAMTAFLAVSIISAQPSWAQVPAAAPVSKPTAVPAAPASNEIPAPAAAAQPSTAKPVKAAKTAKAIKDAMDKKAANQPADTPKTTTKPFDDWQMECTIPDKARPTKECFVFQRIVMKDKKVIALTAALLFAKVDDKLTPVMRFVAPFGVLLPSGLALKIDDDKQTDLAFQICIQRGCMTNLKLEDAIVDKIKKAKSIKVAYRVPGEKGPLTIGLSPKGFTTAFDALKQVSN